MSSRLLVSLILGLLIGLAVGSSARSATPSEPLPATGAWVLWQKDHVWFGLVERYGMHSGQPTYDACLHMLQAAYSRLWDKGDTRAWHDERALLCLPAGVRP